MTSTMDHISELLAFVYDGRTADDVTTRLKERHPAVATEDRARFGPGDAVLISYADTVRDTSAAPLQTLRQVVTEHAPEYTYLHVLPFFPASGDGGFSIVDFTAVDPAHGTWDDVAALARDRQLMVDLVLNHVSADSVWFTDFLAGDPDRAGWFHIVDSSADVSSVFRPRTHPLLTRFETSTGPAHVWTTFSPEQVDLDFSNPAVLEAVLDVLAGYVAQGATMIRLDAVGFVWKELGTPCLHHPKTHAIVKIVRAFLDRIAPDVQLVTETNVPHEDNISYFGDGHDEAQMVYNFSLPPLVLDAFARGDAAELSEWAATLSTPGETTTFFNFLASHDGIGVTPAVPIIGPERVAELAERVHRLGGDWSGRTSSDGTVVPYELNINYADALADYPDQDESEIARRMLAAASIQFALQGVPGVYIHSHLGSRSWWDGPSVAGEKRTINRERMSAAQLEAELADPHSQRAALVAGHRQLLRARRDHPAFDPYVPHLVEPIDPRVFALIRRAGPDELWCVTNVSADAVRTDPLPGWERRFDVFTGREEAGPVELGPHDYRWYRR